MTLPYREDVAAPRVHACRSRVIGVTYTIPLAADCSSPARRAGPGSYRSASFITRSPANFASPRRTSQILRDCSLFALGATASTGASVREAD